MSEATSRVIAPEKVDQGLVDWMHKNAKTCECWLCGRHFGIRRYADHLEKHRAENWKPRPVHITKRPLTDILVDCQEFDF